MMISMWVQHWKKGQVGLVADAKIAHPFIRYSLCYILKCSSWPLINMKGTRNDFLAFRFWWLVASTSLPTESIAIIKRLFLLTYTSLCGFRTASWAYVHAA